MFSAFAKLSSKVSLGGAEDALDEAAVFLADEPQIGAFATCELSKQVFESALTSLGLLEILDDDDALAEIIGIPLDDLSDADPQDIFAKAILSKELYNPAFLRLAHAIKQKRNSSYAKNTSGWIAYNIAMAACSILGAKPDIPKRRRVWDQLVSLWSQYHF